MSNNPTQNPLWPTLEKLGADFQTKTIQNLFDTDNTRFETHSVKSEGFLLDYSKQRITNDILAKLSELLMSQGFEAKREAMFNGDIINNTEQRAVLHTALRRPVSDTVLVNGENVIPVIHSTLDKMEEFSNKVRAGEHKGCTGESIKNIVSIGIGGSDLGPRLVSETLSQCAQPQDKILKTYFVSNIDGDDIESVLSQCKAEETLFVIISKSFKTQETLTNAVTARQWLQDNLPVDAEIAPHMVAVSSNIEAVKNFGIRPINIFPMWDWVNGRFSLWSAVGLSICLQHGFKKFRALLDGAYEMDQQFITSDLKENLPVLLALIGIWNRNFLNFSTLAILPYAQNLLHFPAFLQQLEMESNGKDVDYDSASITDYKTCPIMFGEVGTNGQHSFYQLLHQGSDITPCDFIGIKNPNTPLTHHHDLLLSHMLAQGQAMMQGRQDPDEPYRYFHGNRPNTTILIDTMDAHMLGKLIALYEHKTFTQGVIWNVNSFDQFGVELGKELSQKLENKDLSNVDASTQGLFKIISK